METVNNILGNASLILRFDLVLYIGFNINSAKKKKLESYLDNSQFYISYEINLYIIFTLFYIKA